MESKPPTNLQIAEILRDVAAAYQLRDQNKQSLASQSPGKHKFQIIAYERAADAVEHSSSELKDIWDDGKLEEVPGIGPSIAEHLGELFQTGKSKHFDELMKDIPPEAFKLMELPGIGIKTALRLIAQGKPGEVKKLLAQVEALHKKAKRHLLPYAAQIASEIMEYLLKCPETVRVDSLGSLRRQSSTVGDIDILACTREEKGKLSLASQSPGKREDLKVIGHFTKYPKAQKIIEAGDRTASILLPGEIRVDLMVMEAASYGSALQHFTGSKHHNIAIREYALKKGMSLSEYGVKFKSQNSKLVKFDTEKKFYNFLGLDYIEPELREDTGEIEAAEGHKLPDLVKLGDIKADLQIHSSFDIETSHDLGLSPMEDIVKKGNELGYEYLAFTEHNPSQKGHTDSQIVNILKRKREVVDKLAEKIRRGLLRETSAGHSEKVEQINYSIKNMNNNSIQHVFNSLEIDIKSDGSLPVPEAGLETLDFALVSIHSNFNLERDAQTKRVLTALAHPKVKIFAHPTGRKLNEREGAELNWPEIFDFCLRNNKWIEINADPMRLDLPDTLVRDAVKAGVKLTFGTDAHHLDGMNNMVFGVSVARRGWCEVKNIVNTRSLDEFKKLLQ